MLTTDVLIIGGGLAGTMAALKLADHMNVTVVMKDDGGGGNSRLAQGGIAAAVSSEDSVFKHAADTCEAGCYKNDPEAVHVLVAEGKNRLLNWISRGLPFDGTGTGSFSLGKEGAHSVRRILHAGGDRTGEKLMQFFSGKLNNKVKYYTGLSAVELITDEEQCLGAVFMDENSRKHRIFAAHTILATGGIGGLFKESTNDPSLTGEGIALAFKAGAALKDLEYIQFHPTLIVSQNGVAGLASEALRGEGAVLTDDHGTRVMAGVHPEKDLAPRDVVAHRLFKVIQKGRRVYLNIENVPAFSERFPQIASICESARIQWKNGVIPVRPGEHFHMGGIAVDLWGRTSVKRLYAAGEAACTGVHGANRLASNSLLEAVVFGERTGEGILNHIPFHHPPSAGVLNPALTPGKLPDPDEIRERVSNTLGIVRNGSALKEFTLWADDALFQPCSYREDKNNTIGRIRLMHTLLTAKLIAEAALKNTDSTGAHIREDIKEMKEYEQASAETAVN